MKLPSLKVLEFSDKSNYFCKNMILFVEIDFLKEISAVCCCHVPIKFKIIFVLKNLKFSQKIIEEKTSKKTITWQRNMHLLNSITVAKKKKENSFN